MSEALVKDCRDRAMDGSMELRICVTSLELFWLQVALDFSFE